MPLYNLYFQNFIVVILISLTIVLRGPIGHGSIWFRYWHTLTCIGDDYAH